VTYVWSVGIDASQAGDLDRAEAWCTLAMAGTPSVPGSEAMLASVRAPPLACYRLPRRRAPHRCTASIDSLGVNGRGGRRTRDHRGRKKMRMCVRKDVQTCLPLSSACQPRLTRLTVRDVGASLGVAARPGRRAAMTLYGFESAGERDER
jgi:hypothetical protein